MTKKTLSSEDSALFRQFAGKVKTVKNNTLVLTSSEKPKPYPKDKPLNSINNFEIPLGLDIEKLYQEDSLNFIAPGLQKNVLKSKFSYVF